MPADSTYSDVLSPRFELLTEEYVLVQAWKKTAAHIRYHNWYSDTLELDRAAVNLPDFLRDLAERFKRSDHWVNSPLRIVPAPKSQQWAVTPESGTWQPVKRRDVATKLRPLAKASLSDQVAATAIMLCIADRVETLQGDPRLDPSTPRNRKRVLSYGNRLFCDRVGKDLRHRWGAKELYRGYYQDYRSFLLRPDLVVDAISRRGGRQIAIVHADIRRFYDNVRPTLLAERLAALQRPDDDHRFFAIARSVLDWEWDRRDSRQVKEYAQRSEIEDFSHVALPQGLAAAGFFANVILLDFDAGLRDAISKDIVPGVRLEDACRYVDDLQIVLSLETVLNLTDIEAAVSEWLSILLQAHAPGLVPSKEKTRAATMGDSKRPLVRQSQKMERIQRAISGGFDTGGGLEILDAVQGLIRTQRRHSEQRADVPQWSLAPVPDVRDETVARFAAARFRSTYRSLRPLLPEDRVVASETIDDALEDNGLRPPATRNRTELDADAKTFALGLIENWISDPSNVRLLRIGLDLWPAPDVLSEVLALLRPYIEQDAPHDSARVVALYCLAELFRAGATETGFVEDDECLPSGTDVQAYRALLSTEAIRLSQLPEGDLPWYVRQQVLLFVATVETPTRLGVPGRGGAEVAHYTGLLRYLAGESHDLTAEEFSTCAVLTRRAFRPPYRARELAAAEISARRLTQIAKRDPSFAIELLSITPEIANELPRHLRDDLCLLSPEVSEGWVPLSAVALQGMGAGVLRNEVGILHLSLKILQEWKIQPPAGEVTPSNVLVKFESRDGEGSEVSGVRIISGKRSDVVSMYSTPAWSSPTQRWRFQLGYLIRFILTARHDFTRTVHPERWRELAGSYRAPESSWYQRLYGFFNGHSAFGDDWLPISDWLERLLGALLRWPGAYSDDGFAWVGDGIDSAITQIKDRLALFSREDSDPKGVLLLQLAAPMILEPNRQRPLRVCVVQTVIPRPTDFAPSDPTFSRKTMRARHRNHLSAALAAIDAMLTLRDTHEDGRGRLDWLILPELSVHPDDIGTHLVPFARAHRTIIFAGLTYESLLPCPCLMNSAIWVIPTWSAAHGLQVSLRRQGKQYLSPLEEQVKAEAGVPLTGFRPCQWLVGYQWSSDEADAPLWLTGSVCYDATDLRLASRLRDCSDVFAIPALNKDVTTFDQMALALHYHMFQLVIVANNGLYGGSSAYAPYDDSHVRQVFHLHGQPQASVAFLEIDNIAEFISRKADAKKPKQTPPRIVGWKFPPAGV